MEKLLEFKYSNVNYIVFIHNNKFICKKILSNEYVDVTEQEIELINEVIMQILPTDKIIDLGKINFRGKLFKNFVDNKGYNIFYEVVNNKLTIPSKQDIIFFNQVFNNQEEFVSNNKNNNEDFKRKIKIGGILTSILLSSLLTINIHTKTISINEAYINYSNFSTKQEYVVEQNEKELNFEQVVKTINNNSNLTDQEKEFFTSKPLFIQDNLKYMDYDTVIDQLSNLYINYTLESSSNNARATYTFTGENKDQILVYQSEALTEDNKEVISHELVHVYTDFSEETIGRSFLEAMTEMYSCKYFDSTHGSYYQNRRNTKLLIEIIGEEPLKRFLFKPNINYIINPLLNIVNDEDLAYKLINISDKIHYLQKSDLDKDSLQLMYDYQKEFNQIIQIYYEKKYQESYRNNLKMYLELNYENALREIRKSNYFKDMELNDISYSFNDIYYLDNDYFHNEEYLSIHAYKTSDYVNEYLTIDQALDIGVVEYIDNELVLKDYNCKIMEDGRICVTIYNYETEIYEVPTNILEEKNMKR